MAVSKRSNFCNTYFIHGKGGQKIGIIFQRVEQRVLEENGHFFSESRNQRLPDDTNQGTYSIDGSGNICHFYLVGFDYCYRPVIAVCFPIPFTSVGQFSLPYLLSSHALGIECIGDR